eukprot:361347-Chlamydomonas_euryale.AAC.3
MAATKRQMLGQWKRGCSCFVVPSLRGGGNGSNNVANIRAVEMRVQLLCGALRGGGSRKDAGHRAEGDKAQQRQWSSDSVANTLCWRRCRVARRRQRAKAMKSGHGSKMKNEKWETAMTEAGKATKRRHESGEKWTTTVKAVGKSQGAGFKAANGKWHSRCGKAG